MGNYKISTYKHDYLREGSNISFNLLTCPNKFVNH